MARKAENPIAGNLGSLGCYECFYWNRPDRDDIGIHVEPTIFPDNCKSAGIRADVNPILLLSFIYLQGWKGVIMMQLPPVQNASV